MGGMEVFGAFVSHISDHWLFLMGVLLMVEPLLDYNIARYKDWADKYISRGRRTIISLTVSLFCLVIACFLAFQDEYNEVLTLQGQSSFQREPPKNMVAKLKAYLKDHPGFLADLDTDGFPVIVSSSDNESEVYAGHLTESFNAAGVEVRPDGQAGSESDEQGVMIEITDPEHPSKDASDFMSMLNLASIPFRTKQWQDRVGWPALPNFYIYVTQSESR